ncbi:MAG: fibronectin type III domain-containing protein, partial [Gracilimonas sp.]
MKASYLIPILLITVTSFLNELSFAQDQNSDNQLNQKDTQPFILAVDDFEYGGPSHNWEIENGKFEISEELYYSGKSSLKVEINSSEDSLVLVKYINSTIRNRTDRYDPGNVFTYHVWVPEDTSNIQAIVTFVEFDGIYGDGDEWDGYKENVYGGEELKPASWNKLSFEIPEVHALQSIGLKIHPKNTEELTPPFYLDFIITDPNTLRLSDIIEPITDINVDSVSTTSLALSWDTPEGTGLSHYAIYRNSVFESSLHRIDTTKNVFYIDHTVQSATEYTYKVFPVDTSGMIGFNFYIYLYANAETPAFPDYITWDFESG